MGSENNYKEKYNEILKSERDYQSHGNESFPIGMHKTICHVNDSITENVKYSILYMHWHNQFEFFYLSRGECVFCIDDEEFSMKSGDAIFVPSGKTHWAYKMGASTETVFYALVFDKQMLTWYGTDAINTKYVVPILSNDLVIGPLITRREPWGDILLDRLISIMALYDYEPYNKNSDNSKIPQQFFREDVACPELKVKSLLFDIWDICIENAKPGDSAKYVSKINNDRIHRAIEYMHEHYKEKITLTDIASSVYMSKEYFSHVFKDATNMQPFSYLNSYRIRKSLELLDNTDYKIIEIAAMCGFDHVGYFNRKFMEHMKCTPTEYRRKKKN